MISRFEFDATGTSWEIDTARPLGENPGGPFEFPSDATGMFHRVTDPLIDPDL